MQWAPRTMDELRSSDPFPYYDGTDLVVSISKEEALILISAGATVVRSGCRGDLNRRTQWFSFEGKTYFWLAGYGSGDSNDEYPVGSAVDPRLNQFVEAMREADWG